MRTIEEVSYVLIRVRATRRYGVRGVHAVREVVKRHGLGFVEGDLGELRNVIEDYGVEVLVDAATIEELHEVMVRYRLLPGDALIALTCKRYGIRRILTFDEDFKRIPWLQTVP